MYVMYVKGVFLVKFLPYIARTQPSLTRGKKNIKNMSQRKDEKIQNDDRHFPLELSPHCQITNIIL